MFWSRVLYYVHQDALAADRAADFRPRGAEGHLDVPPARLDPVTESDGEGSLVYDTTGISPDSESDGNPDSDDSDAGNPPSDASAEYGSASEDFAADEWADLSPM